MQLLPLEVTQAGLKPKKQTQTILIHNNKISIFLAIALIAVASLYIKQCGKTADVSNLLQASGDTLTSYINQQGQHVSTIAILHGTVADLNKINASKDSTIKHLQKLVDRHTISATVHGTSTGNIVNTTSVVTKYDTIHKNDTVFLYGKYNTKFKNRWENFDITATKDSFNINYKVFNEFDYVTRYNKTKWYGERVAQITVTNKNPHTETIELKNFTVKPPKNQKLLVFLSGAVAGTISVVATQKLINK